VIVATCVALHRICDSRVCNSIDRGGGGPNCVCVRVYVCAYVRVAVHDEDPIIALACHSKEPLMLTGDEGGGLRLSNTSTGKVLSSLPGHKDSIETLDFCLSAGHKLAATGSLDRKIRVWDLSTSQCRSTLSHSDKIVQVTWHSRDPLLYSCAVDGKIWYRHTRH
jgi:WD40 repeat protein